MSYVIGFIVGVIVTLIIGFIVYLKEALDFYQES